MESWDMHVSTSSTDILVKVQGHRMYYMPVSTACLTYLNGHLAFLLEVPTCFLVETGFHLVDQDGLDLLTS